MNLIRGMVLSLAIVAQWNSGYCRQYQLKSIGNVKMKPQSLEKRISVWDLLSSILQYEGFVTVTIDPFIAEPLNWYDPFIRALQTKLGLPVSVIQNGQSPKQMPFIPGLEVNWGNCNTSYILIVNGTSARLNFVFYHLDQVHPMPWNSRAHFVIITHLDSLTEIHQICKIMWRVYGTEKIIIIDTELENVTVCNTLTGGIKVYHNSDTQQILHQFYSKSRGLEGYTIKVAMFHSPPTATAIPNSTRFEGVDQMVLDTIGRYTNSTMKIHESNPRQHFGTVKKKGFLETLKEVANRKVDIAANMRFIMPYDGYNMSVFEFTSPVFTDRISLIVPKAKKVPIWLSMYHIFDYRVWIPTSCLIVITVILWLSILKFRHNEDLCGQVGWVTINILFLMTGHPISRTIIPLSERLLVVCGLFFAIIMVNSFTSHLFQAYSQVAYWPEIKTLVELNKSGLTIVEGSWGAVRALGETDNPILKELLQKIDHTKDESTAYDLNHGVLDHAILARESRGKYEATNLFLNNNGTELTYAIQSSMHDTFSMAYIVPRGSSFLKKFNTYINRILEAGLIKKWFEDSMWNFTWKVKYMTLKSSSDLPRAFVLSDLKLSWYILTAGLTISCITFLFELVWQFQCHRRLLGKCNRLFFKLIRNIRMRNENSN